jgi:hypothetical protein
MNKEYFYKFYSERLSDTSLHSIRTFNGRYETITLGLQKELITIGNQIPDLLFSAYWHFWSDFLSDYQYYLNKIEVIEEIMK